MAKKPDYISFSLFQKCIYIIYKIKRFIKGIASTFLQRGCFRVFMEDKMEQMHNSTSPQYKYISHSAALFATLLHLNKRELLRSKIATQNSDARINVSDIVSALTTRCSHPKCIHPAKYHVIGYGVSFGSNIISQADACEEHKEDMRTMVSLQYKKPKFIKINPIYI